jgi:hypothetical protein
MKVCQGLSAAFVVFDDSSEAGGPRQGSFLRKLVGSHASARRVVIAEVHACGRAG